MPMFSALVLLSVFLVSILVVAFAFRERATVAREVATVVAGLLKRTESAETGESGEPETSNSELAELLDEAVQSESHQRAILAVNELGGKASLFRTRAFLFSRGLPRITLLCGGGGAFVVLAVGNFDRMALGGAAASASFGLVCSFLCLGLNSATRRHAMKYLGIVDVLGREVDRHFSGGAKSERRDASGSEPSPQTESSSS